MRSHGVAAVVPFYPHSQSASGWMLLGDAFSEQVYTPLDFKMVEQLFDKMAELFLDKLLLMSRLAGRRGERRLQRWNSACKRPKPASRRCGTKTRTLQQLNLRLAREQAADSLLATDLPRWMLPNIVLLGRDTPLTAPAAVFPHRLTSLSDRFGQFPPPEPARR